MSVAPPAADRVLAIETAKSEVPADGLLPDRTADEDAAAVDFASVAIRETPLYPPTVGSQPLVGPILSELLDLAFNKSVADRCAVGEICREMFWDVEGVAELVVEVGDG